MMVLKIYALAAILATALAVESEPFLPTLPPTGTTNIETKQNVTSSNSIEDIKESTEKLTDNIQTSTTSDDLVQKQGRAMNITSSDLHSLVNSIHTNNSSAVKNELKSSEKHHIADTDLSDVSMENDDMDLEFSERSPDKENSSFNVFGETRVVNKPHIQAEDKSFIPSIVPPITDLREAMEEACFSSGKFYKKGEKVEKGCDEICTCMSDGKLECEPRCTGPFFRRGRKIEDPLCSERGVDACCAILVCAADTRSSGCIHENKTYAVGEIFHEGCQQTCTCETSGNVTCKPRCPVLEQRDDCVNIPNSNDSCCMLQLCDVTQDNDDNLNNRSGKQKNDLNDVDSSTTSDMDINSDKTFPKKPLNKNIGLKNETTSSIEKKDPILSINRIASGTIQVNFVRENSTENPIHVEVSSDGGIIWTEVKLKNGILQNLEDGKDYLIRSKDSKKLHKISLPKMDIENGILKQSGKGCMHKGKHRSIDEEFHMGCDELCICGEDGTVECAPLQCPSSIGLDVLDPSCVRWSPDPPDFKPTYPMCCPPAMKCVSNGSCVYKDQMIPNWSEIPTSLSGCEQRCFCENGLVECQSVCAPLPALPPSTLHCHPPSRPAPQHSPGDNCCMEWACVIPGSNISSYKNMTDIDKDIRKNIHRQNDTNNNLAPTPIFVTLPPDLHKVIKESFGNSASDKKYKTGISNEGNTMPTYYKKDTNINSVPQSPPSVKTDKNGNKHYEYPGPYADPNHRPQPPPNGLGSFPFIKKHKEKQIYAHEPTNSNDVPQYNDVATNGKIHPMQNTNSSKKSPVRPNHEDYPINDPYLSSSPFRTPFNQNGPGPGFFNPSTTKNQHDYVLQHVNGNSNAVNPNAIQTGNGIYNGHGIQIGNQVPQGPETIHVYTDGSPVHLEQLLQHIQQVDPHVGSYIPFLTQQHQGNNINIQQSDNENNTSFNAHSGAGAFPGFGNNANDGELQVVELEPVSPTTIRLVFSLPPVMVGLQGRVKLRYTDTDNPDTSTWNVQEFAPNNDLLASHQLEFQLGSLQPDTLYYIQAAVVSRQLSYERKSKIYSVRTLPFRVTTMLPPVIPIEPNLGVGQVNSTSAQITWRPFTRDELHYIDGIQLRYREIDGKLFSGTPLIHRAVTSFILEALKPNTTYEVGIYFIPFLDQHTELQSFNMFQFNTTPQIDMFDWNVMIDIEDITPWSLKIKWSGVPRPAERFVHVYRAVWRAEAARLDASSFSLPTRDAPQEANITNLTPGTKYRIWLELYLTNGKIKNSNVRDIMTKPGKAIPEAAPAHEGKYLENPHRGDYYSALVVVAILAALGAMCSLVLLLLLLRRHRTASAPICGPTPAARTTPALPPYDSPTYKLDLHQETMDL